MNRFCPSCGNRVHRGDPSSREKIRRWWLIPLFILILAGLGLGGFYYYQQHLTHEAVQSFQKGEQLALKGKYREAGDAFSDALKKRPHFPAALLNLKIVNIGLDIESDLQTAKQLEKHKKYDQALATIDRASKKLQGYKGKIVTLINHSISQAKISATVGKLRQEMEGKDSIDALAPILTKAESLNIPEAKEIAKQIRAQIVEIAYSEANQLLNEKNYSSALEKVNDGLKYDPSSEKLLGLKKAIEKAKKEYEAQETAIANEAIQKAQEEYEHNKKEGVQLVDIKAKLDEYGNIEVTGKVKCTATVPVTSVSVSYTLYDENGAEYATNEVIVVPDTLNPGNEGTFDYTHFNVNGKLTVKATKLKWYLAD